jgi:hypothetical protein
MHITTAFSPGRSLPLKLIATVLAISEAMLSLPPPVYSF